ncbi:PRTRC system protein C [Noviherbaspirillum pedocola]|jgi:PRTRC genetic system protein C|uniref:PRTRC system protein C n=1 Tax=Noviherbaspirillum pedocola TaxID=2801341 RepID=A0A934SW43_9BURK|nr:PRTRC system protein C [Noviherbaspirillum pedocola]MBK4737911.1 PRTRC system protein C [Noviherbaspirillum pedocola]
MSLQVQTLTRVFAYNGTELPCPGNNLSVDEVRDIYSATFPELTNATVEGPDNKGDKLVYKFVKTAGAKG